MYYKVSNGSITLGGKTIISSVNFCIRDNEKIGIVGRNGCGKSSLLKAIVGEISFDSGDDSFKVESSCDFKVGYVYQNSVNDLNVLMIDYIRGAYSSLVDLENKIKDIESSMESNYSDYLVSEYYKLLDRYEYLGGYKYKKEYEMCLSKFGFKKEDRNKYLYEFSMGQITKLAFIRLLLSKPSLLILDEPTNHLDIDSILWLEDYLKNYPNSLVVVSHDRLFLDNVCNVIYEIEYGVMKRYAGNYSSFVLKKEEDYNKSLKEYARNKKEVKRLNDLVLRFRYKPTKASLAMSRAKVLEKMDVLESPRGSDDKAFKIDFNPLYNSYRDVLVVKNLGIGYDKVLCNVSFSLESGDKLGIIGSNGIGKSTLIKTLLGLVSPISGKVSFGKNCNIGYFSQDLDNLSYGKSVYDEIMDEFPMLSSFQVRSLLGRFCFTSFDVFKMVDDLSFGEKVRVSLCKILYKRPNVLIMDEVTNHLDIISKEALEDMLISYSGTIVMVSHDRSFVNNICNKLLVLESGNAKMYRSYDEYLSKKKEVLEEEVDDKREDKAKKVKRGNKVNSNDRIEKEIMKLESKVSELKGKLCEKEVYMNVDYAKSIGNEISELEDKIDSLYDELV